MYYLYNLAKPKWISKVPGEQLLYLTSRQPFQLLVQYKGMKGFPTQIFATLTSDQCVRELGVFFFFFLIIDFVFVLK